jgi:hypothetical protein
MAYSTEGHRMLSEGNYQDQRGARRTNIMTQKDGRKAANQPLVHLNASHSLHSQRRRTRNSRTRIVPGHGKGSFGPQAVICLSFAAILHSIHKTGLPLTRQFYWASAYLHAAFAKPQPNLDELGTCRARNREGAGRRFANTGKAIPIFSWYTFTLRFLVTCKR